MAPTASNQRRRSDPTGRAGHRPTVARQPRALPTARSRVTRAVFEGLLGLAAVVALVGLVHESLRAETSRAQGERPPSVFVQLD